MPRRPQPLVHDRADVERRRRPGAAAALMPPTPPRRAAVSLDADACRLAGDRPRPAHAADRLGDGEAGLQAVLVEAGAEVGAAEPGASPPLQRPELVLGADRVGVEERMLVVSVR
jgi:hypothetical protein